MLSDESVDEIIKAYYCFENGDKSNSCYREFIECVYKCANLSVVENIVIDKNSNDFKTIQELMNNLFK